MQPTEHRLFEKAYALALNVLRKRYNALGIEAGERHFSDLWLRDSFYASFGSLSAGDHTIVRRNLLTCLKYIKADGQLPLRIGQKNFILKYLGIIRPIEARYIEDKGVSTPTDSNSLFMIALEAYLEKTKDWKLFEHNYEKIKKVIEWNFTQCDPETLLINEGHYAGWADSLKKHGYVLYTNVLHFKAAQVFAYCCRATQKTHLDTHYQQHAERIAWRINQQFWNGHYYDDWIDKKQKHRYFSTEGNLFAILFGVANKEKAISIQDYIKKLDLVDEFSVPTNYPKYKKKHIYPLFHYINMSDYHNGLQWLWIGCLDAITKHHLGHKEEAIFLLKQIASKILEYNNVYEVYDNGKPASRLFYKSENSFSWSAGLFIWACHFLGVLD